MELIDKVIIISGAGNEMGRELARELVERGNQVAAVDSDRTSLDMIRSGEDFRKDNISLHRTDFNDKGKIELLLREITEYHGRIDILINSAGFISSSASRAVGYTRFGPMENMTEACLPYLKARKEARICHMADLGGFLPFLEGGTTGTLKEETEKLRRNLARTAVGVSLVIAGGTEPSRAAGMILRGIEGGRRKIFIGREAWMMNFLTVLSPSAAARKFNRRDAG